MSLYDAVIACTYINEYHLEELSAYDTHEEQGKEEKLLNERMDTMRRYFATGTLEVKNTGSYLCKMGYDAVSCAESDYSCRGVDYSAKHLATLGRMLSEYTGEVRACILFGALARLHVEGVRAEVATEMMSFRSFVWSAMDDFLVRKMPMNRLLMQIVSRIETVEDHAESAQDIYYDYDYTLAQTSEREIKWLNHDVRLFINGKTCAGEQCNGFCDRAK